MREKNPPPGEQQGKTPASQHSSKELGIQEAVALEGTREGIDEIVTQIEADKNRGYRSVPGIERVGSGGGNTIDFGLGYDWKVKLNDCERGRLGYSNIAAANLLEAFNVSPDDCRKLTDALLPKVVEEDGDLVLKRVNASGEVEDLYKGERKAGYKLSEITAKRKTEWGSSPVYTKEELALYLEAVMHSEMSQEEKNRFVDELLQTRPFDEDIRYSRSRYDGGDIQQHENGTRITLPTGQSLRVNQNNRLCLDSPRQEYFSERSDVVFVMALVERERLPVEALNSIYTVSIHDNVVHLGETHMLDKNVIIDPSKSFDNTIDFPPIYLSFLLTRDPRINDGDRQRLREYFGKNIDLKVVPSDY